MRACLAILKDSFREAAASRVLWVAMIAITVVLLAISPLGLSTAPSTQLRPFELVDAEEFLKKLDEERNESKTPSSHIWSLLNEEQQKKIEERIAAIKKDSTQESGRSRGGNSLLDGINQLLKKPEFYQPEKWEGIELDEALQAANDPAEDADVLAAKNLKRLAKAYPRAIDIDDDQALSLSYGSVVLFGPLRIPPAQANMLIDSSIIFILSVFLGFFGVFASLLVTSTIIPRTFEPGEISLLLSKPVRRSVLFIVKFLGGCMFTLLYASLLVVGVWMLVWTRFGLWRPELLLCIPLYVFLFSIYFSVSALAGAIWRNATVSLSIVVVFWIAVQTIGAIHGFMDEGYIRSQQISEITIAGDEVFVVDGSRNFSRWNPEQSDWESIFEYQSGNSFGDSMQRMLSSGMRTRVASTSDGSRIVSLQPDRSRFSGAASATLVTGVKEDGFKREIESSTPGPVFGAYFNKNTDVILPGSRAIYRFVGVAEKDKKAAVYLKGIFGGLIPQSASPQAFQTLTDKNMKDISFEASVAFNVSDESFAIWDNGTVSTMVKTDDGKYSEGARRVFEKEQSAVIACGGSTILCATADGNILALDSATLAEGKIPAGEKPKLVEFAADGSIAAVMTHGGNVVFFDAAKKEFPSWTPPDNGDVSAIGFSTDGQLIVANGRRSIFFYPPGERRPSKSFNGKSPWPFYAYDYVAGPLYRLLPKPSELNNILRYLVTGEKSVAIGPDDQARGGQGSAENLNQPRATFNLWQSFWSNLAFVVVMVGAGCLYLAWKDF